MTDEAKRALRRHHNERMKERFHRKQKQYARWGDGLKSAGLYANHGKTCSCWMCGNPRKWQGEVTLQEKKIEEAERDWLARMEEALASEAIIAPPGMSLEEKREFILKSGIEEDR